MIIVDASPATKWLVPEPDQQVALAFLQRHELELAGPDLLLTEVASALVRRANEAKMAPEDEMESIALWTGLWRDGRISAHRVTGDLVLRAGRIAIELGHPLKDCVYLALAIELGCDLATCDVKFRDKAQPYYRQIRLLAEFA